MRNVHIPLLNRRIVIAEFDFPVQVSLSSSEEHEHTLQHGEKEMLHRNNRRDSKRALCLFMEERKRKYWCCQLLSHVAPGRQMVFCWWIKWDYQLLLPQGSFFQVLLKVLAGYAAETMLQCWNTLQCWQALQRVASWSQIHVNSPSVWGMRKLYVMLAFHFLLGSSHLLINTWALWHDYVLPWIFVSCQ